MPQVHVVGMGLDGAAGLPLHLQTLIQGAAVLVGSDRHLALVQSGAAQRISLSDINHGLSQLRHWGEQQQVDDMPQPSEYAVVLASGDPLFFGLGRLLLSVLPADWLTFHPHLSSVQLAFSRVKLPWQEATIISAHGRSLDRVQHALQQQASLIAVLTDAENTPQAIAQLLCATGLAKHYVLWVCEDLGAANEQVRLFEPSALVQPASPSFASLNIVILQRRAATAQTGEELPKLGLADSVFASFSDRPNLMTKREVRVLALAELALIDGQTVWDVGAGTGSVAVEIARLCPSSRVYAIEKTAAGIHLIQQNQTQFALKNLESVYGAAPNALEALPDPDRIFIGGSGGHLEQILDYSRQHLRSGGIIVLAIATLDHLARIHTWLHHAPQAWDVSYLQIQLSRSAPVASLTRFTPLNPVTLVRLKVLDSQAIQSVKGDRQD